MILFTGVPGADLADRVILVFGVGLIGTPLCEAILQSGTYTARRLEYGWGDPDREERDGERLLALLRQLLAAAPSTAAAVAVVWSAGRAGFAAGPEEAEKEYASFRRVLGIARRITEEFPIVPCFFHLVSSAGGLFEGAGVVRPHTEPQPRRHYGRLKLAQERLLGDDGGRFITHIHRPTSVYGYHGDATRMGLITALVANGVRNRVSTIYGTMHTLRDYVFNRDVGAHIFARLFTGDRRDAPVIHHLATGRPCSIFEIRQIVERALGRKLLLQLLSGDDRGNVLDITVDPALLPADWAPADVRTGINRLTGRIVAERGAAVPG